MLALDTLTESPLLPAGTTGEPFTHKPGATPRAVVALVGQYTANQEGVKAISYGGSPLERIEFNTGAVSPYPATQAWFLDDIPAGKQTVAVTKTSGVDARVTILTFLADGGVVIGDFAGGSGVGKEPSVPILTAASPGYLLGILARNGEELPVERSHLPLAHRGEGGHFYDIEGANIAVASNQLLAWVFGEGKANARTGLFLVDPNPPPPPSEITVDFETGDLSQSEYVQAIMSPEPRVTVVSAPRVEGNYAGRFEVRDGDKEPDTGSERAEITPGLNFYEGDERWHRLVFRVDSYDSSTWQVIWQLHDSGSGGSPPVALELWHDEEGNPIFSLQHGDGSIVYWQAPIILGEYVELVFRVKVSNEGDAEVGDIFLNGAPQEVVGGGSVIDGLSFPNLPLYLKAGIYRGMTATGISVLYYDSLWVRDTPIAPGVLSAEYGSTIGDGLIGSGLIGDSLAPNRFPTIAVVREFPSDELAWRIDPPGGGPNRWGPDEPLAENVIDDMTLVSEMQGGYKEAKTSLSRDPGVRWPDLIPYGEVAVYGAGFDKRWEGRIEKPPGEQGSSSLEVNAVGHLAALEDNQGLLGIGFINSDHGAWGEPSVDRRVDLINAGFSQAASVSNGWQGNEPEGTPSHLLMDFSSVETVEGKQMLGYAVFDAGGARIGRILFELAVLAGPEGNVNWADALATAADSRFLVNLALSADLNATSGAGELVANPDAGYAGVASYYSDPEPPTHMIDVHGWLLKVIGDHGLPLQGTWPDVGLTAKQMLGYAVSRYSYLEARDEDLDDDGFIIPHAWFADAGELATIIKELTKYGLLDWFVYEDKRFRLKFPGTYGRFWQIPAAEAELQEDGLDGSRLWRDIVVQFQDSSGRTRTVGPPGSGATVESAGLEITDPDHPAVRAVDIYGENFVRRDLLVAQGVLDDVRATKLGENWLAEANELQRSGSCSLPAYTMDDKGIWWPASKVRAGDHVKSPGGPYRKITHCEYQHSERKAACALDAPPEGIAAMQERFQVELQARGLA